MFDISGTMMLVYWLFVYGLKSIWLPRVWPTFNQIFLMMFLSGLLRRSNVLTGAEWIKTRFGRDTGANLAHLSVVLFAIISIIAMLAYAFIPSARCAHESHHINLGADHWNFLLFAH
jgi:solute:Na+ symporter, SSS family